MVALVKSTPLMANRWIQRWGQHRERILQLTVINVALTLIFELKIRWLLGTYLQNDLVLGLQPAGSGDLVLSRQVLISVLMTGIASMVGSTTLFFAKPRNRFVLFGLLGVVIIACSHLLSGILLGAEEVLSPRRFVFDIIYLVTLKYFVFEAGRRPLVAPQSSAGKLLLTRVCQDYSLAFVRITLLTALHIY